MSEILGVASVLSQRKRRDYRHDAGLDRRDKTVTTSLSDQIKEEFGGQAFIADLVDWANDFFGQASQMSRIALSLTDSDVTQIQQLLQADHLPQAPLNLKNRGAISFSKFSELVTFLATLNDELLNQGKKRSAYSREPILETVEELFHEES